MMASGIIACFIVTSLLLLPADPALGKMHFSSGPGIRVPLGPYPVNTYPYPVDISLYYPPGRVIPRRELGTLPATMPSGTGPLSTSRTTPPLAPGR